MKAEQLRKSILQLAIQGKLVPQDPADEPASVLLERIRAEKQSLIKQGKIKKDKGDSVIFKGDDNCYYEKTGSEVKNITDEIPFDIPDSWCWIRLSSLSSISAGGTPERGNPNYWANGTIPWLKISDITSSKKFVNSCTEYITDEGMQNSSAKILPKGTILYTIFATIGEVGILGINASCNQAIAGIQTYLRSIDGYLYYYLVNLQDFMKSISKGCAQFNINQKILKEAFVPLPPLAEQERIVAEIEKFEPLIAEYDKLEQQATKLDGEIYDKLKKSILQHAIQGKLVPQDSNDEPAAVLLERIRAEKKAQLGKKYVESYIYKGDDNCYYEKVGSETKNIADEIPFDIPDSWKWTRLKSFINVVSARRVHKSDWKSDGVPFYRAREIAKLAAYNKVNNELFISEELFNTYKQSGIPQENDLMVTAVGTIGKTYIVNNTDRFYYKDASVICFENRYGVNAFWIKNIMDSPYMCEQIKTLSAGTTVNTITIEKANEYLIPIPPLAEQKRIVEQINVIFSKLKDEI